jgi:acyl-CoA thioesterase-1
MKLLDALGISGMVGSWSERVLKTVILRRWMSWCALLLLAAAAPAYSAPKTLLVVGDSLSAEYGIARGSGWVALLERKLAAQKIGASIVNASVSGETTSGGRSRMATLLAKHKPDVVVIELGANDGLRGLPVAAADANLRAMVAAAKQAGAAVLLVGMQIPPNYGRDYANKFSAMFGKISRDEKVALAPFMLDRVADKADLFQPGRLHPLASAHPLILDNIWPSLAPLLKAK